MIKDQSVKPLFNKNQTKNFKIAIIKTDYYIENISLLEKYAVSTLIENGIPQDNIKYFLQNSKNVLKKKFVEGDIFAENQSNLLPKRSMFLQLKISNENKIKGFIVFS